jgi:septal ring factor EnvC (AmiA/AmiB activator)
LRLIDNSLASANRVASLSSLLGSASVRKDLLGVCAAAALLCGLLLVSLTSATGADAADAGKLESRLAAARDEASSIAAGLRESNEQLALAQSEAAAAEAHEQRLSGLLAEGEERTAALSAKVAQTRRRLAAEKARLRRSRAALAARLVAIDENGSPSAASFLLGSGNYSDLLTQTEYLREISEADSALAARVAAVRDSVRAESKRVALLRERAVAYDERLGAAGAEISAVREAAQAAAAELASVSSGREASLEKLKANIGEWVSEVQEARAAEARLASEAAAEEEVGRWLGGPYSIPTYIVICESGGDYSAVNPSSGAGGAYQILPSTWELYGGKGEPQNGSKAEQDRIAAEIWADSGPSAWVCS